MNDSSSMPSLHPMYVCTYVSYFQKLLETKIKKGTFLKMIEADQKERPKTFHIKSDNIYQRKLIDDLDTFMTFLQPLTNKPFIIKSLIEKYGTIGHVYISNELNDSNNKIQDFSNWIDINTRYGFLSRFSFSSLLPYIFLNVQSNDSILSVGDNYPQICEIISKSLNDGYIFINETDAKLAKYNYIFSSNNYCVISYPINGIPKIIEFDKVLCIAPSTKDGSMLNMPNKSTYFTLDQAIQNHQEQKNYLIDSLKKVKLNGIVVYSTFSLNPFENEAVINSVLQMPEFEGKFELVDCTSMFCDIKRKKGLDSWDLNFISKDKFDQDLLNSLSCESLIKDIDKCMRFYPHQIDCCGTFIAVIKKTAQISKETFNIVRKNIKKQDAFSIVPEKIIQMISNEFGSIECGDNIRLMIQNCSKSRNIFLVSSKLFGIINNFGLEKLRLCHIGCLGFSYVNDNIDNKYVPSVLNLPSTILKHVKSFINIKFEEFKYLIEFNKINVDKLIIKNQIFLSRNQIGGVCIILEDYGPLIGGYVKDGFLSIIDNNNELCKLYKIVKESLPARSFKKQISYLNKRIDENEKAFRSIKSFQDESSNELNEKLNEEIQKLDEKYSKSLESLINRINQKNSFFSVDISINEDGILSKLKKMERSKFDRLFIASQSSNDFYNMIDQSNEDEGGFPDLNGNFMQFELESNVEICGIKISSAKFYFPKSFDITIDGEIVKSIKEANELNGSEKQMTITFDPISGKIIRLIQTGPNWDKNDNYLRFKNIELLSNDEKYSKGVFTTLIDESVNKDPHKSRIYISASYLDVNSFYKLNKNQRNICTCPNQYSWFQIEITEGMAILTGFRLERCAKNKLRNYKIICSDDDSRPLENWITLIEINEQTENEHDILATYKFPNISPPVRFARLIMTDVDWNNEFFLKLIHFDLFGKYF